MFRHILVPLDGSPQTEAAIPVAVQLARQAHGGVILLRVVPGAVRTGPHLDPPQLFLQRSEEKRLDAIEDLEWAVDNADFADVDIERAVLVGPVAQAVRDATDLYEIDLVVMNSRTAQPPFGMEGVTEQVALHSDLPVLVVHAEAKDTLQMIPPIIVALDGSSSSEAIIEPAIQLASQFATPQAGQIHLVRVLHVSSTNVTYPTIHDEACAYLEAIKRQIGDRAQVTSQVVSVTQESPDVAQVLRQLAKAPEGSSQHPIIAMGTHGRNTLQRLLVGSVTYSLLREPSCSIFTFHPAQPG